jgi:nucleoside diphosphate kinase
MKRISPHRSVTLSKTVIKTSQLMMYKTKLAACSEIRTKYSTQSEHHVEFFIVKPDGAYRNR